MRWAPGVAAGGALLVVTLALSAGASGAPPSYTFHMDVAMAMRHFPWLHFHLGGDGEYAPGQTYAVHFTSMPWFVPKQQHDFDLSMLDPAMWSKHYTAEQTAQQPGGDKVFTLRAIDDPRLKAALVTLGPYGRTRTVDATYDDGTHIQMTVVWSNVNGFMLPQTLTADIDEPHLALSANADFKDYAFGE